MADHEHPDCPMASSISVTHCEHGTVYVRLHGPGGELIAAASMCGRTGAEFLDSMATEVEAAIYADLAFRQSGGRRAH